MNTKKSPAWAKGGAGLNAFHRDGLPTHSATSHRLTSSTPVEILLDRLEGVRQQGQGWRARCPAHGSDRNKALSIAAADDGRTLLHCFAGCAALDIVHAVGLELTDLFAARITHCTTPAERRELRERAMESQWKAAIPVLTFEARIVLAAAGKIEADEALTDADHERLTAAVERIQEAREVFCGRR